MKKSMHFCALFPDLFPGAGRDTPIFETNLPLQNLLIVRFKILYPLLHFPDSVSSEPRWSAIQRRSLHTKCAAIE